MSSGTIKMASKRTVRRSTAKRPHSKPSKEEPASEAEEARTRQLLLRVPEELHRGLRHLSIDRRLSINKMLLKVIEDWYAEQDG